MAKYKFGSGVQDAEMSGKTNRCTDIRIDAIEKAVYYFVENHMMDEMTRGCNIISRQLSAGKSDFDFETDYACIETKVFMLPSDKQHGYMQERFHQGIKRVMEHGNSSAVLSGEKRKILLVIGHKGIYKEIRGLLNQEVIKSLQKTVGLGMKLWVAEMELSDGIELLSYANITNDILELR